MMWGYKPSIKIFEDDIVIKKYEKFNVGIVIHKWRLIFINGRVIKVWRIVLLMKVGFIFEQVISIKAFSLFWKQMSAA